MPRYHCNTGRFSTGRHGRHRQGGHGHGHGRYMHRNRNRSPSPSPPRYRNRHRPASDYTYNYGNLVDLFNYHGGSVRDWEFNRLRVNEDKPKPDPSDKDVLSVEKVDFLVSDNTKKHHTNEFSVTEGANPSLVVRRGQPFNIKINFSRPYSTDKDDLRLVFEIGDNPKPSKGTHVEFILSDKDEEGKWGAKISSQSGESLVVTVFTPPDLFVGMWDFKVDVVKRKETKTAIFRYNHADPIYILFNPWCKDDAVFMDNEADRQMYVLEDKGKIYAGSHRKISAKPWIFGQFEDPVLDCCMYLLDISEMKMAVRGNPIPVVRKLSALVNSQDEGGVLTGNWSGNYAGGKSPLTWTGSAPILKEYFKEKYSVRFGQCWVFSGVLTTVCRALGIPARSVTNFASAHDVDASITIDYHYNEDGDPLEDMNEDSIWNFHVWNEVWMSRPDLPAGYGGWQAIDATPQETSDEVYCCGPASVRALKEGEVNLPFDGPFIFAEVNADKMYWVIHKDGTNENVHLENNSVGKFISTLGRSGDREDVTKHYKYAENSAEERVAVRRANQVGSSRRDCYKEGPKDVEFKLEFADPENTFVGSTFEMLLKCTNKSQECRGLNGTLSTSTMFYTGIVAELLSKNLVNVVLKPGEHKTLTLSVPPQDYIKKLRDCCMVSMSAMVTVTETKQVFSCRDDGRLRKPHLTIKGPATGNVGEEIQLQISFTNPLQCTLTKCVLDVEGPGIATSTSHPQRDVLTNGTFSETITVKPMKAGSRELVVIFNSEQLEDINSTHSIVVKA